MLDFIQSVIHGLRSFCLWRRDFHRRLYESRDSENFRTRFLRPSMKVYCKGHESDKNALKWTRRLIILTPAIFIFKLIWPAWGNYFFLCFCVCAISLCIMLRQTYRIMVEVDRIATRCVLIERRYRKPDNPEYSIKLALEELYSGDITQALLKERQEMEAERIRRMNESVVMERSRRSFGFYADDADRHYRPPR